MPPLGRVLCAILAGAYSAPRAGANAGAALFVDLDYATEAIDSSATRPFVDSGSAPFWVGVKVAGAERLDSYEFRLAFDGTRLAFVRAVAALPGEGYDNFLETKGGSAPLFIGKLSVRDSDRVTVGNSLSGSDSARSPSGAGLLALIQFRPLAAGEARFDLEDATLLDWQQAADAPAALHGSRLSLEVPVAARRGNALRPAARWAEGKLEIDVGDRPAAVSIADALGKEVFRLEGLRGRQSLVLPRAGVPGTLILLRTASGFARLPLPPGG